VAESAGARAVKTVCLAIPDIPGWLRVRLSKSNQQSLDEKLTFFLLSLGGGSQIKSSSTFG
jgi:hypothetical protein